MDEDEARMRRRIDEALDRLAEGEPPAPAGDALEAELLILARAVRGLGKPKWPATGEAFGDRLLPPRGRPRPAARVWPGAAAAVVAAGLIGQSPAPLPFTALAGNVVLTNGVAFGAPFQAKVRYAPAVSTPTAANAAKTASAQKKSVHGPALRMSSSVQGVWLQPGMLALWHTDLPAGGVIEVRDLTGWATPIAVRRSGAAELLDFRGLPTGWYRLTLGRGSIAVLLPLPAGSAAKAELSLPRLEGQTSLQGVRLLALYLGADGVVAQFEIRTPAAGFAIALASRRGAERPVRIEVTPMVEGYRARLTFDPVPAGTARLRFLAAGPAGSFGQLEDVQLQP